MFRGNIMAIIHSTPNQSITIKGVTYTNWRQTGAINPNGSTGSPTYEFPYVYDLYTPNSDSDASNRYYPVSFKCPAFRSATSGANLIIARHYGDPGPAQRGGSSIGWTGSSSHQGGLYLSFRIGDSAWSDMYEAQLVRHRMTYHNTVSYYGIMQAISYNNGSGEFYVLLRGGFFYRIYQKHPGQPTAVTPGGTVADGYGWTWPATLTTVQDTTFNNQYTSYV